MARDAPFPIGFLFGNLEQRLPFVVYALREEGEVAPFYIGCSGNVLRRINEHWFDGICGGHRPFRLLHALGRTCRVSIVASFHDRSEALQYEALAISVFPTVLNKHHGPMPNRSA